MIPTGSVTFLFTDIEGSTKLAQEFPEPLSVSLETHNSILQDAVESNNGFVFEIIGDAFCCAFANPFDALNAAIKMQKNLNDQKWNSIRIKIRIGIHTGNAEWNGRKYTGYITLAKTQRVMSSAYGEQILISYDAFEKVKEIPGNEISFRDLGERKLKDLKYPMRLYQVIAPGLRKEFAPLKTLDARPNNLPVQLTSFIGRENDIEHIKKLLSKTHLLTLTGTGGAGKTRLALKIGEDLIDEFANGIWFIDLASVFDEDLIVNVFVNSFGLKEESKKSQEETLIDFLREKELMIIFDNCEQIIEGSSKLASKILKNCKRIKIIATSREVLNVSGEQICKVMSLDLPDLSSELKMETLMQYESARLFIERARNADPYFEVESSGVEDLASICIKLDGIPLAIELAAAKVKVMSLEKIHERLNDRFTFLKGGKRTELPRQQTLEAMINWSYELLSEKEKILFCRLSVFLGGWTLESAEEICSDEKIKPGEILDLMIQLVDKSIINHVKADERFRMLESMREFGRTRLHHEELLQKIRHRHLNYYHEFTQAAFPKFIGRDQKKWMDKVQLEYSNIQTALNFSHTEDKLDAAFSMTVALCLYWEIRGLTGEAGHWLKMLNSKSDKLSDSEKAMLYQYSGTFEWLKGKFSEAYFYYNESLSNQRKTGNKLGTAVALNNIGIIYNETGNYEQAKVLILESINLLKEIGDEKRIADALINLGTSEFKSGKNEIAKTHFNKSLSFFKKIGDKWSESLIIHNLGLISSIDNKPEDAKKLFEESLTLQLEIGDKWGISESFAKLGDVMYELKDYHMAEIYLEECLFLKDELDDKRERENIEEVLAAVKKELKLQKETNTV